MIFAIVIFGTASILMGWVWYGSYLADQKRAQYVNVSGYVSGGPANSYPFAVKFTSDNGTTYTASILHTNDYDLTLAKGHAYEAEAAYPSYPCTGGMLNLTSLTPNTVSFNVTC